MSLHLKCPSGTALVTTENISKTYMFNDFRIGMPFKHSPSKQRRSLQNLHFLMILHLECLSGTALVTKENSSKTLGYLLSLGNNRDR